MDFWEFLARSEWPILAAGALLVFRQPIEQKLRSTTKASGLGVSLEFSLAKAEALVAGPAPTAASEVATPEMIILEAWRQLVSTINHAHGTSATQWLWNSSRFTPAAKQLGSTEDEIAALQELRSVRNRIAHTVGAPVAQDEAERFRQVTQQLMKRVDENKKDATP